MSDEMITQPNPTPATSELFRIKPLEWEWLTVNDVRFLNADAPVGNLNWRIYQLTDGWHLNPSGRSGIDCASPEEGKQLAEQHWQEYIKQALSLVSIDALVRDAIAATITHSDQWLFYDKRIGLDQRLDFTHEVIQRIKALVPVGESK